MERFNELNSIQKCGKFIIQENVDISDKICVENSMVFLGNLISEGDVIIKHNCIVLGDFKAKKLNCHGSFTCLGDFIVDEAEIKSMLMVFGETHCNDLCCDDSIVLDSGKISKLTGEKNLYVDKVLEIDKKLVVSGSSIFFEGIIGNGEIQSNNVIVSEYCEVSSVESNLILLDDLSNDNTKQDNIDTNLLDIDQILNKGSRFTEIIEVKNKIFNRIDEIILNSEKQLEFEEISKLLGNICEEFNEFHEDKNLFDMVLKYSELSTIDYLIDYLRLVNIRQKAPKYIKNISIVQDTFGYLIDERRNLTMMSVEVSSFMELIELVSLIEQYKDKLGREQYRIILKKIDDCYDCNFDKLERKLDINEFRIDFELDILNVTQVLKEEIPEIKQNIVETKGIVIFDEYLYISVYSNDSSVDPKGACIGKSGIRSKRLSELFGNRKISFIEWTNNIENYIRNIFGFNRETLIEVDFIENIATIFVQEDSIPVVVGRQGFKVKIASELTGLNFKVRKLQ